MQETNQNSDAADRAIAVFSASDIEALRPHVINLQGGRFSTGGAYQTQASDVDAIFDVDLERALEQARRENRALRILFWAHGGMVSEPIGLRAALAASPWWKANGVYPIYFVWESGLLDTLISLRPRGLSTLTDALIERALRKPGSAVWGEMKATAERASGRDGGALYTAQKLKQFCERHPGEVELHAAGHSAGAIFHTQFIAAALRQGVPGFATLQLLAPAIRVDTFHKLLAPHIGGGIKHLTIFAMRQNYEKSDSVARIYRKSLLYLVRNALEGKASQEILGLEECLRRDASLLTLFGLDGGPSDRGDAVFAVTKQTTGRSASTTTSHTGFDNDAPTMNSLARRILGTTDHGLLPQDFPEPRVVIPADGSGARGGARRALCVGIDAYPSEPLSGCVADARLWAGALGALAFETSLLLDGNATRDAILSTLSEAVAHCAPGDIFVFQYSGHGTTVRDTSGDEAHGDTPGLDEAIVPFDYAKGAFIIDDELAALFSRIPEGVCFTCFFDCCHSGTMSRFAAFGVSSRPRFLPMTQALQKAYDAFQKARSGATRETEARAPRTREAMREVVFSACRSDELAWESNGNGEFTAHAVPLLPRAIGRLSNEQFLAEVTAAFGRSPRQHPFLDCNPSVTGGPLVGPTAPSTRELSQALL